MKWFYGFLTISLYLLSHFGGVMGAGERGAAAKESGNYSQNETHVLLYVSGQPACRHAIFQIDLHPLHPDE